MQVILMHDVARLGQRHDIVDVPQGRALNMLIPQGLAVAATPENKNKIASQSKKIAAEREAAAQAFHQAAAQLDDTPIKVAAKANEKGHLFEALKEDVIAAALSAHGIHIEPTHVTIAEPIKEVGTHEIHLSNGEERVALNITVTTT